MSSLMRFGLAQPFLVVAAVLLVVIAFPMRSEAAHIQTRLVAQIDVPMFPESLAVDAAASRVYVNLLGVNQVAVIDSATNTLLRTVPVGTTPVGVATNPATGRAYVSNFQSSSVSVIDANAVAPLATIGICCGSGPLLLDVDPLANRVYVALAFEGNLAVLDASTNLLVAKIPTGGSSPTGVAVNPTTGRVYVTNQTSNSVAVIDTVTQTLLQTIVLPSRPLNVAVNLVTNRIYVLGASSPIVWIIDGVTNSVTATIPLCCSPNGIAVNPVTDHIYVTNGGSATLHVIDGATNAVTNVGVQQFGLGNIGPGIAVDASRDRVYAVALRPNSDRLVAVFGNTDDTTPPVISFTETPAPNANGWSNTDVTITWSVSDPESGIVSNSGCATTVLTEETLGITLVCSARNGAGLSNSQSVTVKIDNTAPAITFSGNAGSYTVDQTILITCVASDALSGIASTSCPAVASGSATNYVGTTATTSTTLTATATDNADNSASATTSFTVTVTADGVCRLTASLSTADDICAKVTSIATAPNAAAKTRRLHAFDSFLAAQTGKSITAELADLLSRLAHLL